MAERRILLVDDNASDRLIAKVVAEKCGYIATEASDGFQAIAAMEEQEFGLFLIDLQMPKMPGLQLVQRLRRMEAAKKTPILIMSGRNRAVDVQAAVQSGANDYIVKPMDIQVLEEKLRRLGAGASSDWKLYEVPEPRQQAQATMFLNVLSLNELGADLLMSLDLPLEHAFALNMDVLLEKGLKDLIVKIESKKKEARGFLYRVRFVGATEADRKKIRLSCRDLWHEQAKRDL